MPRRSCRGTNEAGEPCGSPIVGEDGWCPAHRPDGAERMAEIGRKGAESTARKLRGEGLSDSELPPLDSPQAAERWCEAVARAVAVGRLSHNAGRTIARLVREFLRSKEAGEYADRVENLEEHVARLKAGDLEVMK